MAKEDFVSFYTKHAQGNAALKSRLDLINDPNEFVKAALEEGAKAGFSFSETDVIEVMEASAKKQAEQLTDKQLDGVVGGADVKWDPSIQPVPTVKLTTVGKIAPVGMKPGVFPGAVNGTTMCCW